MIKSYAKINLSLNVLGRINSNLHKIETLVSFIDLNDEINIKKINKKIIEFISMENFQKEYQVKILSQNL